MSDRLLTLVNAVLVLICAACVYYLVTSRYEEPKELRVAESLLAGEKPGATGADPGTETTQNPLRVESGFRPGTFPLPRPTTETSANARPRVDYSPLQKPAFAMLYTPTPTPPPTPTPTPPPPNLEQAVAGWVISSIVDEQTVEFQDARTQETFTMNVGGPPHPSADQTNQQLLVQLVAVDMNELKVTLGFEGQQVVKSFQ